MSASATTSASFPPSAPARDRPRIGRAFSAYGGGGSGGSGGGSGGSGSSGGGSSICSGSTLLLANVFHFMLQPCHVLGPLGL